jgi:N6-L-threonylcarbamoyladenine synthase
MKRAVIGFDTSNYRTSAAVLTETGEVLLNIRELLPVPKGERGIRQSEAVFAHLRGIQRMLEQLRQAVQQTEIIAVAASVRPRDPEESYMPVFTAGAEAAGTAAAVLGVPFIQTTHQRGHLAAAAWHTALEKADSFLAAHLSGGTTDLLHWHENRLCQIGGSLDLHAGQLVDRAGVAMGLSFPSGPELEQMAMEGKTEGILGCSMERGDLWCHFSGAETQIQRLIAGGSIPGSQLAREVYDLLARTVSRMLAAGERASGESRALVTGGVASSPLFRQLLTERMKKNRTSLQVIFGAPEYSGDNAVGVALIGLQAAGIQKPEP